MQIIEHPVKKLRAALISSRLDLIERYQQYSDGEKKVLEDCLRPDGVLFRAITVRSDSDWIPAHPEESYDFQSFFSNPYRSTPCKGHHTIYIQTIGSFGEAALHTNLYVEWLRQYCEAFYYGLVVKTLPPVTVQSTGCTFRVNSCSNNLQLYAGDLLRFLKKRKPKDAFCIVGITMIDLYPKESWNFVFGQASLTEGMGVFSFARYDDNFYQRNYAGQLKKGSKPKPGDYSVFNNYYIPPITSTLLLRSCKVVSHEVGHMFGLQHCQWLQCVMQGSNHLEESDRGPLSLCPICLRELQSSIGSKIADRYKALLQWVHDDGGSAGVHAVKPTEAFQEYGQWLQRCLAMME
ncbi:archaemetzincin-2 isoform X1 [Alosa sapidissima]|uniref:archaemetzincin-2 isoform X1 n=1 Tax=Alosa sapidissima TaxID=34773 RepID=UPI001C0801F8|nr:archaemetzincin-2 isoform X1 [Alosa sapidissima]